MVSNGDGRMPPLISPFHNILCFRYPVHIAHFCMAMQFHPLSDAVVRPARCEIRYLFNAHDGTDGQFVIKLINHGHAFYFYKRTFGNALINFRHLIIAYKYFKGEGIRKIRNIIKKNGFFILNFPFIRFYDFSPDNHLPHFSDNIFDIHRCIIEIFSIYHIRVVRALHCPLELPSVGLPFGPEIVPASAFPLA